MKKYLSGLFAIALAIGFSSFTTAKKTTDYGWFEQTGNTWVANNTDLDVSPLGCYGIGSDCVKAYIGSFSAESTEPATGAVKAYANE